jgi:hypothetical protein
MKPIARNLIHAGVIAGAAFMLSAMSTLATARPADAQDMSEAEASADAESADFINVVGKWTGTISDDRLGGADITINIEEQNNKNQISGAWSVEQFDILGKFTGKVTIKGATLELGGIEPKNKACKVKFTATELSSSGISGTYKYVGCGKDFKGDKGGNITLDEHTM